nr:MAG TPA: holin [Caudoviricetes sp.]
MIEIATVPAVLALVNLLKKAGLPDAAAPVVSLLVGVLAVLAGQHADVAWVKALSEGLILGLAAAGVYDITKPVPKHAE